MHEMSLAGGILKLAEDAARRERFARVTHLRLEAGRFAGVEVRALRFAIEAMSPGTCLDGAEVEIDEPPGTAWCLQCNGSVMIERRADPCPQCGSFRWQATGGTELRVVDMRVID